MMQLFNRVFILTALNLNPRCSQTPEIRELTQLTGRQAGINRHSKLEMKQKKEKQHDLG